jgi:biotin carboxyl carrier protein
MKLNAEIDGERLALDVRREAGARVVAEVDGRRYELEAREPETGVYLLFHEGRVFECRGGGGAAAADARAHGRTEITIGGRTYGVALSDPKRLGGVGAAGAHAGGRAEVVSPMPGKIVRVLVAEGAEVAQGAGLVVVEAMKMQNEMKSPKAGTVVELRVEVGATVNAGDVLVVVE